MRNYLSLPAPQMPSNALIDFGGLNNALGNYQKQSNYDAEVARETEEKRYQRGRQAKADGIAAQDRADARQLAVIKNSAGVAQMIDQEQDPVKRQQMWGRFIASDKRFGESFAKYGMDPNDHMQGPKFLLAQARGYQEPAQADVKEVGGRLVRVSPDGSSASEIYSPQPGSGPNGPYESAKQVADVEAEMRKEFTAQSKDYTQIREGYRRVETGAKVDNGAGDLAVVYGYMKMLDPTSVVREGEFATAENTTGVPAYVMNLYNKIIQGDRLPPEARARFVESSKMLYDNATTQYGQTKGQFEELARRKSIDPRNIIIDQQSAPNPQQPPPQMQPRAQVQGGQGQIPPDAVRFLRQNANDPAIIQQFEQKYGPGSARQFLGNTY